MRWTQLSRTLHSLAQIPTRKAQAQAAIQSIDFTRPFSPNLIDTFGRKHDYLRISLVERCNLRCFYCMPEEGIDLSPKQNLLTTDEIIRLSRLFVQAGVKKIRLTGGEPTVRKDILDIVARLSELRSIGLKDIAMTSNGIVLHRKLPALIEGGLTHLNLSLDTLDPFKFEFITRRPGHEAVMRALRTALDSPLQSVKLNAVIIRGLNDTEVLDLLALTKDDRLCVRFIEYMPFTGNKWDSSKMVPSSELLKMITERHPGVLKASDEENETARTYSIPGFKGSFGFISSMSDHFCSSCNRLRITADGQIKVCLFDPKEISLRDHLRSETSDDRLLEIIGAAVRGKKAKHAGMENIDVVENRPMIKIAPRWTISTLSSVRSTAPRKPALLRIRQFSSQSQRRNKSSPSLTHIDEEGRPSMVNVSAKEATHRSATAFGRIYVPREALELILSPPNSPSSTGKPLTPSQEKARRKGDVLTVAQLAAIMGCKRTSDLIPLCHPLAVTHVDVQLVPDVDTMSIACTATVRCAGPTGVEMEALTAVNVGLLTVWDMLKAVAGQQMTIGDIKVIAKKGGKADYTRDPAL